MLFSSPFWGYFISHLHSGLVSLFSFLSFPIQCRCPFHIPHFCLSSSHPYLLCCLYWNKVQVLCMHVTIFLLFHLWQFQSMMVGKEKSNPGPPIVCFSRELFSLWSYLTSLWNHWHQTLIMGSRLMTPKHLHFTAVARGCGISGWGDIIANSMLWSG